MVANIDKIEEQLWNLQRQCSIYKSTDCLADWVLFAVSRYINTGRATRQFELQFVTMSNDDLMKAIKYCLNYDKSDDGIIKGFNKFVRQIERRKSYED